MYVIRLKFFNITYQEVLSVTSNEQSFKNSKCLEDCKVVNW